MLLILAIGNRDPKDETPTTTKVIYYNSRAKSMPGCCSGAQSQ